MVDEITAEQDRALAARLRETANERWTDEVPDLLAGQRLEGHRPGFAPG